MCALTLASLQVGWPWLLLAGLLGGVLSVLGLLAVQSWLRRRRAASGLPNAWPPLPHAPSSSSSSKASSTKALLLSGLAALGDASLGSRGSSGGAAEAEEQHQQRGGASEEGSTIASPSPSLQPRPSAPVVLHTAPAAAAAAAGDSMRAAPLEAGLGAAGAGGSQLAVRPPPPQLLALPAGPAQGAAAAQGGTRARGLLELAPAPGGPPAAASGGQGWDAGSFQAQQRQRRLAGDAVCGGAPLRPSPQNEVGSADKTVIVVLPAGSSPMVHPVRPLRPRSAPASPVLSPQASARSVASEGAGHTAPLERLPAADGDFGKLWASLPAATSLSPSQVTFAVSAPSGSPARQQEQGPDARGPADSGARASCQDEFAATEEAEALRCLSLADYASLGSHGPIALPRALGAEDDKQDDLSGYIELDPSPPGSESCGASSQPSLGALSLASVSLSPGSLSRASDASTSTWASEEGPQASPFSLSFRPAGAPAAVATRPPAVPLSLFKTSSAGDGGGGAPGGPAPLPSGASAPCSPSAGRHKPPLGKPPLPRSHPRRPSCS